MTKRMRTSRRLSALLAGSALAAACGGGGVIALLPVVGPIGGSWSLDSDNQPDFDFTPGETIDVAPTDASSYPTQSRYDVAGLYATRTGPCRTPDTDTDGDQVPDAVTVTGTIDDGRIVLRRTANTADECMRGVFADVRTIQRDGGGTYRNGTTQLDLSTQFWVNADDASQRFIFTEGAIVGDDTGPLPVVGCRRIGSAQVAVTGTIQGFDSQTNTGPLVTLTIDNTTFRDGTFRGASEIRFVGSGSGALTLRRTADARGNTAC